MNIKINFNREKKRGSRYTSDFYTQLKELCSERDMYLKDIADYFEEEVQTFRNKLNASSLDTDFILKVVSFIDPELKIQIDLETSTLKIV